MLRPWRTWPEGGPRSTNLRGVPPGGTAVGGYPVPGFRFAMFDPAAHSPSRDRGGGRIGVPLSCPEPARLEYIGMTGEYRYGTGSFDPVLTS